MISSLINTVSFDLPRKVGKNKKEKRKKNSNENRLGGKKGRINEEKQELKETYNAYSFINVSRTWCKFRVASKKNKFAKGARIVEFRV